MKDINKMSMKDFDGMMVYLKNKKNIDERKPIPLKQSQKDMIKRTKERK